MWVQITRGLHFRLWRDPGPVVREYAVDEFDEVERDPLTGQFLDPGTEKPVPILQGYEIRDQPYLDWDVPLGVPVTYWLETAETDEGPWAEAARHTVTAEPALEYSVMQDVTTLSTLNVRDALAVFYSTRLAQLAAEGAVIARKPEWKKKFPMVVSYDFDEANLPLGSVEMSYGSSGQGDLGWNYTEEDLKFSMIFVAQGREERDSVSAAVRGLMQELDWFLSDLGCVKTCAGEMSHGYQNVSPILYSFEIAIGTTAMVWHGEKNISGWKMLPVTWLAADDEGFIVSQRVKENTTP